MGHDLSAFTPIDRWLALAGGVPLAERAVGAALFADISGFTQLAEQLARTLGPRRGAEELTGLLNQAYGTLVDTVHQMRGSVISFSGDAITCWFDAALIGDPTTAARRAVACGLALQARMAAFRATAADGLPVTLALKVGIAAGPVRRLVVGDEAIQRFDLIAGATLDQLAAAEHAAQRGEVVIAAELAAHLGAGLGLRPAVERYGADGPYLVVTALADPPPPAPWPTPGHLADAAARPWLLNQVADRIAAGRGQFLAELRPVAILFGRFAGFDVDADAQAATRLDAFLTWAQRVIAHHGGALLQITIGDKGAYYYAAFGAPVAHEDDMARAARAALELVAPPAGLGGGAPQIGLSRGTVWSGAYGGAARRTYGVLGDEVNLAARLMQAAPAGGILASEAARAAAGGEFHWEAHAPISVKGKAQPIAIYQLRGAARRSRAAIHQAAYELPLVGRQADLALIAERIAQAQAGAGQLVAVVGDAGVGKSRLIAEAARRAAALGFAVVQGEGQSYGGSDAYLIWESVWRTLLDLSPEADLDSQIAALESRLAAVHPALPQRLPLLGPLLGLGIADNELTASLDARLRKISLEGLLTQLLRHLTRTRPTLIVLEDLQWVDPLSLDLLELIARAGVDRPLLILAAARPPERASGLLDRIVGLPASSLIELGPFAPAEAAELIALKRSSQGVADALTAEAAAWIAARAEGNPFYIGELLNYLHDLGLTPRTAADLERLDLPAGLQSLILSRIDRLSESEQAVLKMAAVVGRLFRAAWLWGANPALGDRTRVRVDLSRLEQHDLTIPEPVDAEEVYLFKHILTQTVAYESLPFATRALLHGAIGDYVEAAYPQTVDQFLDLLAYHYERSLNADRRRIYLRQAGEAARAAYNNVAAVDYFRRLLPLVGPAEVGPLQFQIGAVLELMGDWEGADAAYTAALAAGAAQEALRAECRKAIGWLRRKQSRYDDALEWLALARADAEAQGDLAAVVQCLALIGECRRMQGDFAAAGDAFADALARARPHEAERPVRAALAETLKSAGTLAAIQGDLAAARERYLESLALRFELGDRPGMAAVLNNLGTVALYLEDYASARSSYDQGLELSRQVGDSWSTGSLLNNLGIVARYQGDLLAAREFLEDSIQLRRRLGDRWGVASTLNTLTNLLLHAGEAGAVEPLLRESLQTNQQLGDRGAIAYCLEDCAGLAAARGEHARALRLAAAAAALRQELGAALPPAEEAALARLLAPARAALDPAAAAAAAAAGQAMPLAAAIAEAL